MAWYSVEFTRDVVQSGILSVEAGSPKEAEEKAKKKVAAGGEPEEVEEVEDVDSEEWIFEGVQDEEKEGEADEDGVLPEEAAILEFDRGKADAREGQDPSNTGEDYLRGYQEGRTYWLEYERGKSDAAAGQAPWNTAEPYLKGYREGSRCSTCGLSTQPHCTCRR
jgi:hypothetical protein